MSINFDVDAALAKLSELATQHGPQAVDLAAAVVQVDAVNTLSGIPGYGALLGGTVWAMRWVLRKARPEDEDDYGDHTWLIGLIPLGIAAAVFAYGFMYALLNVWAWVGLFNPKLALAHEVFLKLAEVAK